MNKFEYIRAHSLDEALQLLGRHGGEARALAGGTDLLLVIQNGKMSPHYLVDIGQLDELSGIRAVKENGREGIFIGACTTMREIERSPLLADGYHPLSYAASTVGSVQIRNRATIGGNVCHASPSADTAPALLALDAEAEILTSTGLKRVPLERFFLGPGRTVLEPGQLLTGLYLPRPIRKTGSAYIKHSLRQAMDLAFVGVATRVSVSAGKLVQVRVALGAVAPTPIRAYQAEQVMLNGAAAPASIAQSAQVAESESCPIDDVRSSAWYRRRMVQVETERALRRALEMAFAG